jgi:hypothetical protein
MVFTGDSFTLFLHGKMPGVQRRGRAFRVSRNPQ